MDIPIVANENNPTSANVVEVEVYKEIVGQKRKANRASVPQYAQAIRRAAKVL